MVAVLQNIHSLLPRIPPNDAFLSPCKNPHILLILLSPFSSHPFIPYYISSYFQSFIFFSPTFLTSHIHSTIGESEEEREQLLPSSSPDQRGVERQIRRRRGMMMGEEIKGLGRRGEVRREEEMEDG